MNDTCRKLTPLQKSMSKHMIASWTEVPQFHVERKVDCGALSHLRGALEYNPSFTTMTIKTVADVLSRHPDMNASWGQDTIIRHSQANIGIAVDTGRGLLVPVVPDASSKSLFEIHKYLNHFKERAERGNFSVEELQHGTFSISNLGMLGVDSFTAIVNYPQSAILAMSAIREVPVVREGTVQIAKRMSLTLSVDHRVTDGASAARFLGDLCDLLENSEELLRGAS